MTRITAAAIVGAIGMAVLISHATISDTDQQVFDQAVPRTFRLLNPANKDSGGTGFLLQVPSGRTLMISNAHVCSVSTTGFMVSEQGGRERTIRIIEISADSDLCVLEGIGGIEGLALGPVDSEMGEKLYITGHPYLQPVTLTEGFLNGAGFFDIGYCGFVRAKYSIMPNRPFQGPGGMCAATLYSYTTNAASAPGNSGSAVTNSRGQVVGVLFAGNGRGVSLVVPGADLHHFVKDY